MDHRVIVLKKSTFQFEGKFLSWCRANGIEAYMTANAAEDFAEYAMYGTAENLNAAIAKFSR